MNYFKTTSILVLIVSFLLLLTACSGSSSNDSQDLDIIEQFAGSGGPGDFYRVTLNMTDQEYSHENLTTGSDTGSGEFEVINSSGDSGIFRLDTNDLFVKLQDEIIVVADSTSDPGERITVALKETDSAYNDDITGTYNLVTSMEGAVGQAVIDGTTKTADIYLDMNGDSDYNDAEEQLLDLSYDFNETYKAIELVESDLFKHYGVFIDNTISVWDSYYWNGSNWQGDGMALMLKQPDTVNLADYVGQYNYIDVDGYSGSFSLTDIGTSEIELKLSVDGEVTITNDNVDSQGIIHFTADFVEPFGTTENWSLMVLPNKAMIISSTDTNAFSGDGGFAVAVKEQ